MNSLLHYYQDTWCELDRTTLRFDICVYGGTAAGLAAAASAIELGKSAVVLHPGLFLGGMTTGGLGLTDSGNREVIGGFSRRFYRLLGRLYAGRHGKGDEAWRFEPSVARQAIDHIVQQHRIAVYRGAYLESIARSANGAIKAITMRGGRSVEAEVYIDATYEGDLMALAGVPYTVGRESNAQYDETVNGFQIHAKNQFPVEISPYRDPDDPRSGLLPGLQGIRFLTQKDVDLLTGKGDSRVQAYNFRVCMSDDPDNLRPFPRPESYDASDFEICARWLAADPEPERVFNKHDRVTPTKTDTNNHSAFSTDYIGASYQWPDARPEEREQIFQRHVRYQQGYHYYMAHDLHAVDRVRVRYAQWGLAADEFPETDGWPHQLYIREGRRMLGDYILTELDCTGSRSCDDPVGMGAYTMDSHNCERVVVDGVLRNEGDVQVPLGAPYGISLRSIIPPAGACPNLVVPVAISASHIAFGSARMEPVFMVLGESAATIAVIAADRQTPVQGVRYSDLREVLGRREQVLDTEAVNTERTNPPDNDVDL